MSVIYDDKCLPTPPAPPLTDGFNVWCFFPVVITAFLNTVLPKLSHCPLTSCSY